MIPKIIHYCWFGNNPLPLLAKKCIQSWEQFCPDYAIIEWNEKNFDLSECPIYVQQAYEAKKWAFVTDYARLKVVYEYGGIYLDTDVEVKKCFDFFLNYQAFFGFEDENYVNTGLGFGAIQGAGILEELMKDYENISFIKKDGTGDMMSCPVRNLHVFLKHGLLQNNELQVLKGNILILPTEYLSPCDVKTGLMHLTENTYSVHHFSASWCDRTTLERRKKWQRKNRFQHYRSLALQFFKRVIGDQTYEQIKKRFK